MYGSTNQIPLEEMLGRLQEHTEPQVRKLLELSVAKHEESPSQYFTLDRKPSRITDGAGDGVFVGAGSSVSKGDAVAFYPGPQLSALG